MKAPHHWGALSKTAVLLSLGSFAFLSTSLVGCKHRRVVDSKVESLSAENKDAKNIALFMGFPGSDGWISNNLWPLRDALTEDASSQGFKVDAQDSVGLALALEKIKVGAANVSENGTLLIMIAGHGTPDGQIKTHDGGFMSFSDVGAKIVEGRAGKGRIKRLIFLVFSCYSGNWVNGARPVGASENYAKGDAIDTQLAEMSSLVSDQATMELAGQLSRSRGIYEQLLVMSSQVNNQLSWGSYFGQNLGDTYRRLRSTHPDTATIGDWVRTVATTTASNSPQYRAFPEYEIMNDSLFQNPKSKDVFVALSEKEGQANLRISVPKKLNIRQVGVCFGDAGKCINGGNSQTAAVKSEDSSGEGDRSYFEVAAGELKAGTHVSLRAWDDPQGGPKDPKFANDLDEDGVDNPEDLCADTPAKATVFKSGEWMGCADKQIRDRERKAPAPGSIAQKAAPVTKNVSSKFLVLVAAADGQDLATAWDGRSMRGTSALAIVEDGDFDGIDDKVDFCYPTPFGVAVVPTGAWQGCTPAEKSQRESLMAPFVPVLSKYSGNEPEGDTDLDKVLNKYDRCPDSPAGETVWKRGVHTGCAGGEKPSL